MWPWEAFALFLDLQKATPRSAPIIGRVRVTGPGFPGNPWTTTSDDLRNEAVTTLRTTATVEWRSHARCRVRVWVAFIVAAASTGPRAMVSCSQGPSAAP